MGLLRNIFGIGASSEELRIKQLEFELGEERAKASVREYEIGKNNRITAGYPKGRFPVNNEVRQGLVPGVAAAWHLVKNNSLGARYKNLAIKNISGPYGFTLDMKCELWSKGKAVLDDKGDVVIDTVSGKKIIRWWDDWKKKKHCDVSESKSFRRLVNQVVMYSAVQGEYLVRKVRDNSKYGFRLLVLDPSLIDEQYTVAPSDGNNAVIMGVEYDSNFKRVAVHLKSIKSAMSVYSSYNTGTRTRVPMEELYYDFDGELALQARGVSPMTPSLLRAMLLWDYEKAAATNAVAESRLFGVLEKGDNATGDFPTDEEDSEGAGTLDVDMMEIQQLPVGWKLNKTENRYPSQQYEMFTKITTKFIASGLDVSYITLANDLTETSYASGRIGLMDEQEGWRFKQEFIIESFLDEVFADALESAIMLGGIDLGSGAMREFERFNKPYFHGKRFDWIDPAKDAQAIETKLKLGLTSEIREAARNGDSYEELIAERAEAEKIRQQHGVSIILDGVKDSNNGDGTNDSGKGVKQ